MAYFGDDGQRNVQVSATRQMPSSGNGADMFMRIKDGNGTFATQATSGNAGTGVISQGSIVNQAALTGDSYTIAYTGPTAAAVAGNTGDGAISTPTVVNKAALTGKDYGITFSGSATYDVTDLTVPSNTQTITTLDFSGGDGTFVVDAAGNNTTVTLTGAAYVDEAALVQKIQDDLDAGAGGIGAYTVTSIGTVALGDFAVSIVRAAGGAAVTVSAANAAAIAGGVANSPGGASVLADQPYVSGQNISFDGLQFNIQDGATPFATGDTFTVLSPGYTVTDTTTAAVVLPTPPATGRAPYVSGQAISFDGIQIDIQGDPVDGDTFTVSPSTNESVFKTLADLIAALNAPVVGASLTNSLNRGLNQLDNALNNVLTTRSSLGLRLNEIDALQTAGEDLGLQFKQTLSELQDVDYNQAISDLVRQQTNLQAAQQTFSKVAGLSLFDYI
jgi:flagellin-like hook-associated protein FlgL